VYATNLSGTLTGTATGLTGTPNITVGTINCTSITGTGTLGLGGNTITSGTHNPNSDNQYNLGASGNRWANVYATNLSGALTGPNSFLCNTWYTSTDGENRLKFGSGSGEFTYINSPGQSYGAYGGISFAVGNTAVASLTYSPAGPFGPLGTPGKTLFGVSGAISGLTHLTASGTTTNNATFYVATVNQAGTYFVNIMWNSVGNFQFYYGFFFQNNFSTIQAYGVDSRGTSPSLSFTNNNSASVSFVSTTPGTVNYSLTFLCGTPYLPSG
jgi:hypothetical protein